jgi:hypothetical protein
MKLATPGGPHLGYCTNIHPGESWAEVRANIERHVTGVRSRVCPDRPLGVGLRLGMVAARELGAPGVALRARDWLEAQGLYVFTVNGFVHGRFHGTRVKEDVYLPDWTDGERLAYTRGLAGVLADLAPEGEEVSISTVPGAFKPRASTPEARAGIAEQLRRQAADLAGHARRGRRIVLALEPEPCCMLETVAETVAFFEDELCVRSSLARFAELADVEPSQAEALLRAHVGLCLDTCHAAVELETPREAVRALGAAGIRIAKLQLSAGLRIARVDAEALAHLAAFDEPVYLHQVVERDGGGAVRRFVDLADAFAAARAEGFARAREWRVHFHVPVFLERLERFEGTQPFLAEILDMVRGEPVAPHLEVETYTWDVLPEALRRVDVVTAVARELGWVLDRLGEAPREGAP